MSHISAFNYYVHSCKSLQHAGTYQLELRAISPEENHEELCIAMASFSNCRADFDKLYASSDSSKSLYVHVYINLRAYMQHTYVLTNLKIYVCISG